MRCFIGMRLGAEVEAAVARVLDRLASRTDGIRWGRSGHLHLTLNFLGEVSPERAEEIRAALRSVPGEALELSAHGVGCFPEKGPPRVVWAGVGGDVVALHQLQQRLTERLEGLGIAREQRGFHPHLTMGRARRGGGVGNLQAEMRRVELATAPVAVREFSLYESRLSPSGPEYRELESYPLGQPS